MAKRLIWGALLATVALAPAMPVTARPADRDSTNLRNALTVKNIRAHQRVLQRIANRNDDTRASGTPGYEASADYVARTLAKSGYIVTRQEFPFPFFEELSDAEFARVTPDARSYALGTDFATMEYSGSAPGGVTGALASVDLALPPGAEPNTSTSGCETEDFRNFPAGAVALLQRGTCPFGTKAENAQAAGAIVAMTSNFILNNFLTYRDQRLKGIGILRGLLLFYLVCSVGLLANVGVAFSVYDQEPIWWLAGAAGALMGVVWNYAMSGLFVWRKR